MSDPANTLELAKEYDFTRMTSLSEFTTRYMWAREKIINDEDQFYVNPDKVPAAFNPFMLSDAGLSITARETPESLAEYAIGQPYISGVLTSRDHGYSQLYGFWDMLAKLPNAIGTWPAFWSYPTFDKWPDGIAVLGEIDIMEATQKVIEGIYHGSLHTNESGQMVHSEGNDIDTGVDLVNEFHRYGMSWDPDYIVWYFDGVEVLRRKTPADMQHEPRHFLLNLAVGGWGGKPNPADYPASLDVKWIRIYKSDHVAPEKKESAPALCGDVLRVLQDGTVYTKRDARLSATYLKEIADE